MANPARQVLLADMLTALTLAGRDILSSQLSAEAIQVGFRGLNELSHQRSQALQNELVAARAIPMMFSSIS